MGSSQDPSAAARRPTRLPQLAKRHERLAALADPLLAQSAIDRLQSTVWELVVEGESYRRRQKPTLTRSETTDNKARP